MPPVDIAGCWLRIERWLSANAPGILGYLPSGVDPDAVAEAEEQLDFPIPHDLKAFLAAHNGSGGVWLHERGVSMSLKGILEAWDMEFDLWGDGNNDEWAKPEGLIKKKWFSRKWLPYLDAWNGDYTYIDLDPPKGGTVGQVISWLHDNGPTEIVTTSFAGFIHQFVEELEAGQYVAKVNQQGHPYLDCR